ncbi:MAG: hypothetical protein BWZ10_00564 [candidate division BRC1 bacterium ADurb.BinA364]|nr:MAG: hypothetical protein BWZ10_00564 [candidate division BRC1 bacterium ADurb.BinA364]
MMVEMELREVQIKEDPGVSQIVILGEKDGQRTFPIFIGYFEAQALYCAIHGDQPPRPLTHDLIYNIIDGMEARLIGVCVDDLRDDTFHGKLILETQDSKRVLVDTRPSDAIVLAMKRQAPIFVEESVLEQAYRPFEGESNP